MTTILYAYNKGVKEADKAILLLFYMPITKVLLFYMPITKESTNTSAQTHLT